jgi:hypothetical protein
MFHASAHGLCAIRTSAFLSKARSKGTNLNSDRTLLLRLLFAQGGLVEVAAQESPGIEESMPLDLNHATEVLKGVNEPFTRWLQDGTLRAKIDADGSN